MPAPRRRPRRLTVVLTAGVAVVLAVLGGLTLAVPANALPVPDPTGTAEPTPTPEPPDPTGPRPDPGVLIESGRVVVLADGTITLNGTRIGDLTTLRQQAAPASSFTVRRPTQGQWDKTWDPIDTACAAMASLTTTLSTDPLAPTSATTSGTVYEMSPYFFVGCRVRTTLIARLVLPITVTGPSRTLTACAQTDPTCFYLVAKRWDISGEYPDLFALVRYFNSKPFGTWTAGRLVSTVSIQFTRA